MDKYTPTTEEVYRAHWRGTPMRSEDGLREHVALDRWLAEVKAQAVAEWQKQHWAEFNKSLALDPYRQGEEHTHTKRSSFGDPYCKTCGIDLEGETE